MPKTLAELSQSQPAWAAWIEMWHFADDYDTKPCRSPHGLRGLKYCYILPNLMIDWSQPAWAAWIEIFPDDFELYRLGVAARMGCVD